VLRNYRQSRETQRDPRGGWWRGGTRARIAAARARIAAAWLLGAALTSCAVGAGATANATLASPSGGRLQLLTEPGSIAPIYDAIDGARTSIDMTMYELDDPVAERALAAAANRGVRVRVLLNGGPDGEGEAENASASSYLRAHRVLVRWSPSYFALTHQKTITIDDHRSLVMTLNLTSRYYANTRDFAVWDDRPADVSAIESVFDADWAGRMITASRGSGDLLWSPGAESALVGLIETARTSIDVENEEMADQPIIAALCHAAEHRVRVRVVMTYESEWASAFSTLARCGAGVRVYHGETPLYIHAKEIVVDDARAYVGSQNFSYDSLERNRELGLITTEAPVISGLERTFTADYRGAGPA
jgi:phosphatidylserine/phosphatidylglycerophosphate/cardiolipin synthase-like enzyme